MKNENNIEINKKKYEEKNLIIFSINIEQKKHSSGKWKKNIIFPKDWQNYTLEKNYYNAKFNGLALITGKVNNLFVIDIDNVDHWKELLIKHNKKEPQTVKVKTGTGGIHLYFKYSDDLESIKSCSKCFGKDFDIDIRTNGGCIIVPPSKYYNNDNKKEVEYIWENDIFDNEIKTLPPWIKTLLLNKNIDKDKNKEKNTKIKEIDEIKEMSKEIKSEILNTDSIIEDSNLKFTIDDIESLVKMLDESKYENYNDWINVGICLHNIDSNYLLIWIKWSKQSEKYEDGSCDKKWKSFKKSKDGLKIGSLLMWAKNDSPLQYEMLIKKKMVNGMIHSKYPNDKLILGETINVTDKSYYTNLNNKECLIKGSEHTDMPKSMYIEVIDKFMTIKCRHQECFGKTYPCHHILMNKNEMNIAFNGDVNITINNNGTDDELVEFQQIDIYDDPKINELIYNSLTGKSSQFAEIIYYYYENDYMYGEDENWYVYKNHKWENTGKKNNELRYNMQPKLKKLYSDLYSYYKENDYDKNKIKSIKNIMNGFGDTNLKNNIMTELIDIYTVKKNPDKKFTLKLDSNNNLIGFDNGVFDLTTFEFREGKPEDFISLTVGYNYQEQYTEKYNDLLQFLEEIQPNKDERDYMLTYLSIGLIGNQLELFTILTGSGRNGKSKLIELLKLTLGDYFGSVQSQMFTRPRPDANSPDPGLLSLMKKRIVMASEPEKNSKLNSGFIKFITGRDSTTLRNCHSNDMIDFTAKFITLLICNDIPDCDDMDNAFSKRLRCVNFPTEFVNDPIKENQKKIDVNINKNFEYWKLDFMLLLIKYYKKYTETHELKTTENILKWTNQYKEDTDLYLQFLNECTEESTTHIHTCTLYESFKIWFKNNNPNAKIPGNKEFVANIKKHKEVLRVKIEGITMIGIKNLKLIELNF
jgi:P4 family phage/plasmid primase-like protien